MIKKQGITVTIMVVTIIILTILATTITITTYSTINYSKLSAWTNEIIYIQDIVDEQMQKTSVLDFVLGDITIDISTVDNIDEQFNGEEISESNSISLKILNLGKLKVVNTVYGNLQEDTDVYAVSEKTGKVYYVKGLTVDNKIYYGITDGLKERMELTTTKNNLSSIVYRPNKLGYTKNPVTVLVKIPKTFTNIEITTSNDSIIIGEKQEKTTTYEYLVNAGDTPEKGNYTITVTYNNGVENLTSIYEVNGYDDTTPNIREITYSDFVYKSTEMQEAYYITNVTATDDTGIKVIKYAYGDINENEVEEYFKDNGYVITNGKINCGKFEQQYTIYAEDYAGNFAKYTFDAKYIMPDDWKTSVEYIHNRVPIPKGFVASQATGENTRNGGLVIYEGTTPVSDVNVYEARRERNQYVWVNVNSDNFLTNFVRQNYANLGFTVYNINTTELGNNYWEVILDNSTNMPTSTQNTTYMTDKTASEVKAMYESVRKYGGFYVARYETGKDSEGKVSVTMGKYPYNEVIWSSSNMMNMDNGGAVEIARSFYDKDNSNYGVVSTLIYGVQWDSTLLWFNEMHKDLDISISTSYGNYSNRVINADEFDGEVQYAVYDSSTKTIGEWQVVQSTTKKLSDEKWLITTGGVKTNKICNIYDMAGNLYEWTMEGSATTSRVLRGGACSTSGVYRGVPILARGAAQQTYSGQKTIYGFRLALYLK